MNAISRLNIPPWLLAIAASGMLVGVALGAPAEETGWTIEGQPVVSYRTYAFFAFRPGVQEPVITGIQFLNYLRNDRVRGYAVLDVPEKTKRKKPATDAEGANSPEWGWAFIGENQTKGLMTAVLADTEGDFYDEKAARKSFGKVTLQKTIRGTQIWWEGQMVIREPEVLEQRINPQWRQAHHLVPFPEVLEVKLVGFPQTSHSMRSEAGTYPGKIAVGVFPKQEKAAREWLKSRGYIIENDGKSDDWFAHYKDGRRQYWIEVPAFDENLIVWRMLKSGLFSEAHRLGVELGPGETYSLALTAASVFPRGNADPGAAGQALQYTRELLAKLRNEALYRDTQIGDLVVLRNYKMQFTITGRSHLLRTKGDPAFWDRLLIQLAFMRELGQPESEVTLAIQTLEEKSAKSPGAKPPANGRFEDISEENDLLPRLGTKLGDLSNALSRTRN